MVRKKEKIFLFSAIFFIFPIFLFFVFPSNSYSSKTFDLKIAEATEFLNKGDLINAYVSFSVAYEHAENTRQKADVMVKLGNILFKLGDTFAAEKIYEKALTLDPGNFEILKKVIVSKAENLSPDFKAYLKKIPKDKIDSEILYYWGKYVLLAEKNPKEACNILDSVRKESEFFYRASYLCGIVSVMRGDRDDALRRFESASLSPDITLRDYSLLALARIYSDSGYFQKAYHYYSKITEGSPVFYDAKYEVCWVLYGLEKYREARECVEYYRRSAPKSHLTKRIEVLSAFLTMNEDLVGALLTFTSVSDSAEMILSKIVEVEKMPLKFWEKDYIDYFSAHDPDIVLYIQAFPEYKDYLKKKTYIEQVKSEIKSIIQDMQKVGSMSAIVADKSLKKYFERVWFVQERIMNLISSFIENSMEYGEKNVWLTLYSLSEELRKLDFKARELAALSAVKSLELYRKGEEFKNWEKKLEVYRGTMNYTIDEIKKLVDYQKKSASYFVSLVNEISSRYDSGKNTELKELIKYFGDSQDVFFDFANLWQDLIQSLNKFLYVQERKLRGMYFILDNFSRYLDDFKKSLVRYIVLSKLRREFFEIYALAQYGFIEAAWIIKESESEALNRMHAIRLREEDNIRINFSKVQDELDKIELQAKPVKADSVFEEEVRTYDSILSEIIKKVDTSSNIFSRGSTITFTPPQDLYQIISELEKKSKEETQKKKNGRK